MSMTFLGDADETLKSRIVSSVAPFIFVPMTISRKVDEPSYNLTVDQLARVPNDSPAYH